MSAPPPGPPGPPGSSGQQAGQGNYLKTIFFSYIIIEYARFD